MCVEGLAVLLTSGRRGQRSYKISYNAQDTSILTKKYPMQMLIVPGALETIKRMNAGVKCRKQSRKVENDKRRYDKNGVEYDKS